MLPTRLGLIVPSSNTTMETELPEMFARRAQMIPEERFTFHSSRMRMLEVTADALAQMDRDSNGCAVSLADAQCDAMAYACLVAIMSQGPGAHVGAEGRLTDVAREQGCNAPVVSSAGALVRGLDALGAQRISMITPYVPELTQKVREYIEQAGVEVVDVVSLGVADNCAVGRLDPTDLPARAARLNRSNCDAVVLSACVQMPSLAAIPEAEARLDLPVLSAATATTYDLLTVLGRSTVVPNAGYLLSKSFAG
ncbi:maleate isomerase [Mycobacterium mantenii]|uniref:Maleate isomerase n=1 Tax=Mycobacterium mantenii TaxID=560555 RepID=A0A1X0FT04_MYCNT|nr:aspartate/glutamate racemase family protein [Mycobacterium mantenii]MCV7243544.1 aspartate/glutamate racemase family protein [Mycobacterium mantenii]ORB04907.1 Asp/Glu racemase [Mycobacterium mantenii]BBY38127.1 maleate isomerase [Mycobacterium mantenii]